MEEKRAYRRVEYRTEITCTPEGGQSFTAISHDVSLGGMFIESEQNPAFGTKMVVSLYLPGHTQAFDLACTVRWNKPDGFGVQFGRLGAKETHALTKLA